MDSHDKTPVTVLGLGRMGSAIAATYLAAGHPVTVWNRTAEKASPLVDEGATLAGTAAEAAGASPLVVVCVTDYTGVRAILDPLGPQLAGRTVVSLTNGTSRDGRDAAAWAAGHGVDYLDGVVSDVPRALGKPETVLLYSGPSSVYAEHETTLRVLGGAPLYLGADHGLTALYDVAINTLMWSVLNAFQQGAALVSTAGVDAVTWASLATELSQVVAGWLDGEAGKIDAGDYSADDVTVDTHLAAMHHAVDESRAVGVNAELPELIKSFADRAVADGRGGDGYAALIEQFRVKA